LKEQAVQIRILMDKLNPETLYGNWKKEPSAEQSRNRLIRDTFCDFVNKFKTPEKGQAVQIKLSNENKTKIKK
jgi:hypothetical protein